MQDVSRRRRLKQPTNHIETNPTYNESNKVIRLPMFHAAEDSPRLDGSRQIKRLRRPISFPSRQSPSRRLPNSMHSFHVKTCFLILLMFILTTLTISTPTTSPPNRLVPRSSPPPVSFQPIFPTHLPPLRTTLHSSPANPTLLINQPICSGTWPPAPAPGFPLAAFMAGVDVHHYQSLETFCRERLAGNCACVFSPVRDKYLLRCRDLGAGGVFRRVIYCYLGCACPNGGSLLVPAPVPEVNAWLRGPALPGLPVAELGP